MKIKPNPKPLPLMYGPWFVRHCDDDACMNMTVVSRADWGDKHTGMFEDEEDTVAIIYRQISPRVCGPEDLATFADLESRDEIAHLIALAPDHALMLWAMSIGGARWEAFTSDSSHGEVCFNGLRHCSSIDAFGCPAMTDNLRSAIRKMQSA